MSDEKLRILKILEEGKITAREAEGLLRALGELPEEEFDFHGGFGKHFRDRMHHRMYARMARHNPGRMVAEVMKEVNPGDIVAQVMASVGGAMQDWDFEFPGRDRKKAEEEQTLEFQGIRRVEITNLRGDVTVRSGGPEDGCQMKAEKAAWGKDDAEAGERLKSLQVSAQQDGQTLRLKVEGGPWTKKLHAQVDFSLEVPSACDLALSTVKGDFRVQGISGTHELKAASGDLAMEACSGRAVLSTANGDIGVKGFTGESLEVATINGDLDIAKAEGRIALSSVSGDISASDVSGDSLKVTSVSGSISLVGTQGKVLEVQTQSGDIEIDRGESREVKGKTVSGDLEASLSTRDGTIDIHSTSGDVDLTLGADTDAQVECETMSGDIEVDLPIQKTLENERRFQGVLGSGRGSIRVSTTSGDISLQG